MSNNKEMIAQKKKKNARKQRGASLVEYALLVSLVAIAAMAALQGLGGSVTGAFTNIAGQLDGAAGGGANP